MVSGVEVVEFTYATKLKKHVKATEFIENIKSSTRSLDPYLQGSKIVNYTNQNGGITPIETKLNIYKDKMGALIDADKLLDAVENNGQALRIPNFTLGIDDTKVEDLSFYFVSGSLGSIQAKEYDSNIIEVSVSNNVITIKALKEGITNIVLSDGNFTQSISVIVRKVSANGSGWL